MLFEVRTNNYQCISAVVDEELGRSGEKEVQNVAIQWDSELHLINVHLWILGAEIGGSVLDVHVYKLTYKTIVVWFN